MPALTAEELGSLVELAIETSASKIPAIHLALIGPEGPLVTGDGLTQTTVYA